MGVSPRIHLVSGHGKRNRLKSSFKLFGLLLHVIQLCLMDGIIGLFAPFAPLHLSRQSTVFLMGVIARS